MKRYRLVFRSADHDIFMEIVHGIKTIETRAATSKYKVIKPGDILTFVCGKETYEKEVIKVTHFQSLHAMLNELPLHAILPSAKTTQEAEAIYASFPRYKEKIEKEGILALHLTSDELN